MFISRYICLFMLYNLMGWVYESIYAIIKTRQWDRRGFFYGPYCPIYGVCALLITGIMRGVYEYTGVELAWWHIFLISMFGSAIIEYVTSLVLEKFFHARWWDYSEDLLNINGRICLFASLGFGVAGVLIVNYIGPFAEHMVDLMSPLAMEIVALLLAMLFAADFALTVSALMEFDNIVAKADETFNRGMENLVDSAVQKTAHIKENLVAGQKSIDYRYRQMSIMERRAVRRVKKFRYGDEKNAKINHALRRIRHALERTDDQA